MSPSDRSRGFEDRPPRRFTILPDADDLVQGRTRACVDARTCVAASRVYLRARARGKDVSCSDLNTIPPG